MLKDYSYVPLINMGNMCLDYEELSSKLVDDRGRALKLYEKIDAFSLGGREHTESIHYKLNCAINWRFDHFADRKGFEFSVLYGQNGLVLKIKNGTSISALDVSYMNSVLRPLITEAKKCLFKPIGVVHFPDGDCYLRDTKNLWQINVSKYELFEEKEKDNVKL